MAKGNAHTEQVLMLVKTYPTPSASYGELVCTAGIRLRDREWIRIYPYPFRLVPDDQRFEKGDVLEVPLVKAADDPRPESHRLHDVQAIRKVAHYSTSYNWEQRMQFVRPTILESVNQFKKMMFPDDGTWGPTIRPIAVQPGSARLGFEAQPEWTDEQLRKLQIAESRVKSSLFADEGATYFRQLKQVPYKFRLQYTDAGGDTHTHTVLDWEIARLYFNTRQRVRTDNEAKMLVRKKVEGEIFANSNDVYIVLGNIHHHYRNPHALAIDGFMYPKRSDQPPLFQS